jgi:sterol desaturase/sphingolipid hydroxylase (fatty acid hydroxylase superfamily)
MSDWVISVHGMMSPSTCSLLAQIFPVFLLVFAVRDGQIVRTIREEKPPSGLEGWKRWLSRLRSSRASWVVVTTYFLLMEAWLIAAADGALSMPKYLAYIALVVLLFYAALELWAQVLPGEPSGGVDPAP